MVYFDYYKKLSECKFENMDIAVSESTRHHILTKFTELASAKGPRKLTVTERQVCVGLALGLSTKEIAKARGSSNRTVEAHIANIKTKIGCSRLSPILLVQLAKEHLPMVASGS